MAFLLLLSAVLLWDGEYTEEGVKVEEGASTKEQGESAEPEKELSASATETEAPMEVSVGVLVCLMRLQISLLVLTFTVLGTMLKDNSYILRAGLAVLCIFAFRTDLTVFCFHVLFCLTSQ